MKAILFDIDGTLADVEHRRQHLPDWQKFFAEMHLDPVKEPIKFLFKSVRFTCSLDSKLRGGEYILLVVTARPEDYREVTEKWLVDNELYYDKIYMRKSGDFRQDAIVKAEILQQIIDDGYNPFLVVDDRPQVVEMWRSYGITTLQCAPDEVSLKHDGKHCLDILVGPSGAGKSRWAYLNAHPHDVVSTDTLREQYGWGHSLDDLKKTWNYAHSLLKARLENHIYTVFDATNIKRKDRLTLLRNVPQGQYVRYIVIDRPLDEKLKNRDWRSEELILKHHKTFQSQLKDILAGDSQSNVVVIDERKK